MISTNINKRKQPKLIINTASFCISDAPVRTFFFLAVQSLHNHNTLEEQIQLNSCLKKKKKKRNRGGFFLSGWLFCLICIGITDLLKANKTFDGKIYSGQINTGTETNRTAVEVCSKPNVIPLWEGRGGEGVGKSSQQRYRWVNDLAQLYMNITLYQTWSHRPTNTSQGNSDKRPTQIELWRFKIWQFVAHVLAKETVSWM